MKQQASVIIISLLLAFAAFDGVRAQTGFCKAAIPRARNVREAEPESGPKSETTSEKAVSSLTLSERVDKAIVFSMLQLNTTVAGHSYLEYPIYSLAYTQWHTTSDNFWTSGFFPGCLWLAYQTTGDANFLSWAETWTQGLESQKSNTGTHDIGFIIFNSFGNGYRLTGIPAYKDVVLEAAQSLASRFDPDVGCIRSWDWGGWQFPVIIDNMMNLELLFWAAGNGGQPEWYDMAVSHALKTLEHHVRLNGSTCHVVDYDPLTGAVLAKSTWQGYSSSSTWARGQAWALYGFAMAFRETANPVFLDAAGRTADFFVDHLPQDHVPFWDFDAPGIPNTERDTSAAAIAASGLLGLSALESSPVAKQKYLRAAKRILGSLCRAATDSGYLAMNSMGTPTSPGILVQGCYHHPDSFSGGAVCNESLIWGDYYFLEALIRYQEIVE